MKRAPCRSRGRSPPSSSPCASPASPDSSPGGGGESNLDAQERGLAVMQNIIARHPEQHVVISTHGNLMALIMNALDKSFDYDFWRGLSFPEIYRLTFDGEKLSRAERIAEITVRK
jgi:broad specificity phosphatase PhoE